MIGRTNSGTGGGGCLSPNNAVIHVTAPVGSTITFSKGGVVAKVLPPEKSHINAADSTMADWYFSVSSNNYGTWIVVASLNEDTGSETITIDSNKEYDITLTYSLYLFKSGYGSLVTFNKHTNVAITNDYIQPSGSNAVYCQTADKIDLTVYSSFKVEAIISWVGTDVGWTGRMVVRSNLPSSQPDKPTNSTVASQNFRVVSERTVFTLSVETFDESYNLGFAGNIRGQIFNMWLER